MRFSQRIGKRPVKSVFQIESIDDDLKNRLWNIFLNRFESTAYRSFEDSDRTLLFKALWKDYFNLPLNKVEKNSRGAVYEIFMVNFLHGTFYRGEWHEAFDIIEFLISMNNYNFGADFTREVNEALRMEVSAYRIIDSQIVQINSEEEIQAIEEAIESTDRMKSVNAHLKMALDMLSDRTAPDYRNSIKESISAVEAYCNIITGDPKATLGKALAIIEKKHGLHGSLKSAFNALYGYTSDAGGIRHAMLEDDVEIKFEDAKLMMVSCSSFINYLGAKVN